MPDVTTAMESIAVVTSFFIVVLWIFADAAGGRTAKIAFNLIPVIAGVILVASLLLSGRP